MVADLSRISWSMNEWIRITVDGDRKWKVKVVNWNESMMKVDELRASYEVS